MGSSELIIVLAMGTFALVCFWAWGSKRRAQESLKRGDRSHATDNVDGGEGKHD